MKKLLILLSLLWVSAYAKAPLSTFENGDIVFQDSPSAQSMAVKLATHSRYSHMGIIYKKDDAVYVYEAIGPVVLTPIKKWIQSGKDHRFVVKRLKDTSKLTTNNLQMMKKVGESFASKPYDGLFGWGDDRIYCSELVWKIYQRALGIKLGELKKLKEFDLSHPIVKAKLRERYGRQIPLNELVIAPQGIFDSPLLQTIDINTKVML